jgi:hypothetical protein
MPTIALAMTRQLAKTLVAISYPLRLAAHLTEERRPSGGASVTVIQLSEGEQVVGDIS